MKHTISCLVRNEAGVLARVARSFADEKVNISSVAVGTTENSSICRITIVVDGDDDVVTHVESVVQQLPSVLGVEDLASREYFARELLLVKVEVPPDSISRMMQMAEVFDARVIGMTSRTMTFELAAEDHRIDAMLKLLEPMNIVSMARSGRIAVSAEDSQ
jgi:acetolactate synthase I/III small subunit